METRLKGYQHDNDKQQQELIREQATIQQQENQIAELRREITIKKKSASIAAVLKQQLKNKDEEVTTLKETKATEKRKRKVAEKEKDKAIAKSEATKNT